MLVVYLPHLCICHVSVSLFMNNVSEKGWRKELKIKNEHTLNVKQTLKNPRAFHSMRNTSVLLLGDHTSFLVLYKVFGHGYQGIIFLLKHSCCPTAPPKLVLFWWRKAKLHNGYKHIKITNIIRPYKLNISSDDLELETSCSFHQQHFVTWLGESWMCCFTSIQAQTGLLTLKRNLAEQRTLKRNFRNVLLPQKVNFGFFLSS